MRRSARWIAMGAALLAAAVLLTMPLPRDWASPRLSPLADMAHFFLYGAVTAGLVWVSRGRLAFALAAATLMNGLCEASQLLSSRNANVGDFLRGLAGSAAVALWVRARRGPRSPRRLAACVALVLILSSWPILEAVPSLLDIYEEYRWFPVLCDFRSSAQLDRWRCSGPDIARVRQSDSESGFAGRFLFRSDRQWVVLYPMHCDWRGYHRLCFEATVEGEPLEMTLSLGPLGHRPQAGQELPLRFPAGTTKTCLRLPETEAGAGKPVVDLSRVQAVSLWPNGIRTPRSLVVRKVWLE